MKKLLALLLAMMMVLSLVACGGSDEPVDADDGDDIETSDPVDTGDTEDIGDETGLTDNNGDPVTQETIDALTAAYNAIAVQYNDIAMTINENGWGADEQTLTEVNAITTTIGFVGEALTNDLSLLDGTNFDELIRMLEDELPPALEEMAERVSVPYEG